VQVTYLAYPGNSGLDTIDYRITDIHLDPFDHVARLGVEQPIRLPDTYWCYQPIVDPSPEVAPLPALTAGHVTFGCLNNFCKVTPATLAAWCRLLVAVPHARLLLHTRPSGHRSHLQELFVRNAVDPQRLSFVDLMPKTQYFESYQSIDIALDPFPFPGGTTTCDALWMGVPVISLAGPTPVTRGGLTLLSSVGLPELAAHSVDDYIEKATALARDLPRLAALRASLRERMQRSPLMDAPRFARNLEAAYREMWRRWCAQAAPSAVSS
jgi:predicted O-linked N-acetylglucosamine transferase (SPINDLY family)